MNKRQQAIITLLLERKRGASVHDLAEALSCSEKTIRNDCKVIDQELRKTEKIRLVRKRGVGLYLEGSEQELRHMKEKRVATTLHTNKDDEVRRYQLIRQLLLKNKEMTLQALADQYYVNKGMIRHDLEEMEAWLQTFGITIVVKQKVGIALKGNEQARREALSRLTGMLILATEEEQQYIHSIFAAHEIQLVKAGLQQLQQKMTGSFTDEAVNQLVTHILVAIARVKVGSRISIAPEEAWKVAESPEYEAILHFLHQLERQLVVKLPPEEQQYLAIRVLGAKVYYDFIDQTQNQKLLQEAGTDVVEFTKRLVKAISEVTDTPFTQDALLIEGLVAHVKTTFYRIKHGLPLANPMMKEIKKRYFSMFELIYYVIPPLEHMMAVAFPPDEIAYLTLHFQAANERLEKKNAKHRKVLVVCTMGIGMSQLIVTKLQRKFHSLEILGTASLHDAPSEIQKKHPDLVISTVAFEYSDVPILVISPLMTEEEELKIEQFIEQNEEERFAPGESLIQQFMTPTLVFIESKPCTRESIIKEQATAMQQQGYVMEGYLESVLQREQQSSTAAGGEIAIPHGNPSFVFRTVLAITVMRTPMQWGTTSVSLVMQLAARKEDHHQLQALFKEIFQLTENLQWIRTLQQAEDTKALYALFC
ncbi:pts modulated transcriptional regulator, mtlr family protein [Fictibacillus macauensis ZFHKF-1]|uniref:Pts modulated transcriptional regulator, mtlr family protein n=1 Tax=Fictibacillus macauensis ZFHKF-1 TaxID=1196324 RepID=I8IZ25_9BACL|nr:BglG family transcription antiterminator [Fictibacillus macauensis]EIT84741.1 pts modulated transcriptional regulator, mtlr family protein [Fictibacillus macauensis ZFHKF-1]